MKNNILILVAVCALTLSSCSIRHFTETEYNVLNTLYQVTGEENSPLVGFLPQQMEDKSHRVQDNIKDVKIFVGRFPECLIENGNIRGYMLNLDPENVPCVGETLGYHKFRWVELTSESGKKIFFFLSEKIIKDSVYERAKIFYYSDSTDTYEYSNGGFHFNREVRVYKGMLSGKIKTSRNTKEKYIIDVKGVDDHLRFIKKVVSKKANKISGTKPLVFHLPELLFEDSSTGGIKLVYHDVSSKIILQLLKKEGFRTKN